MYAVQDQMYRMYPLYGALTEKYVPVCATRGAVIAHRYTYSPPRCRTSQYLGLLFACQYLCGTILVTPYSMVWGWRVSREGPKHFNWLCCSLPFFLLLFSFSLLSFYGSVLWGWGLRTDWVLIALSQPCTANLF